MKTENTDKRLGKSLKRKQSGHRAHPHQSKRSSSEIETDIKLDKILEKIKSLRTKQRPILDYLEELKSLGAKQSTINVDNAINHPQLIKVICKAALDGSMPLQKSHLDALKPHRDTVRKLARARPATRMKLIAAEVARHNLSGESILKTVLEGVMSFLPALFP